MQLKTALATGQTRLAAAGVPSPRADTAVLTAHVLGVGRGEMSRRVVLGYELSPAEVSRWEDLITLRADRVPLQHLTGTAAFRLLELAVGPGVFVPRAETEFVAGLAIDEATRLAAPATTPDTSPDAAPDPAPLVVDLCTGSGAIVLSVAAEVPAVRCVALEVSPDAVAWAVRNVDRLGLGARVELRQGDVAGCDQGVLADLVGRVDVVTANPPYIPPDAEPVEPEVRDHDPQVALYGGGTDGLQVPRAVVAAAGALLRPGGLLVMEHGEAQGPATRALARDGWRDVGTGVDLTGRDRCLVARRGDAPARSPRQR